MPDWLSEMLTFAITKPGALLYLYLMGLGIVFPMVGLALVLDWQLREPE
jgi:hypothetical protein